MRVLRSPASSVQPDLLVRLPHVPVQGPSPRRQPPLPPGIVRRGVRIARQLDKPFGPDKDRGGFMITGIKLTVRGEVEGLDAAGFEKAAQAAKVGCPVSKALTGVDITLDAALD